MVIKPKPGAVRSSMLLFTVHAMFDVHTTTSTYRGSSCAWSPKIPFTGVETTTDAPLSLERESLSSLEGETQRTVDGSTNNSSCLLQYFFCRCELTFVNCWFRPAALVTKLLMFIKLIPLPPRKGRV